jgi:hypothetical protein
MPFTYYDDEQEKKPSFSYLEPPPAPRGPLSRRAVGTPQPTIEPQSVFERTAQAMKGALTEAGKRWAEGSALAAGGITPQQQMMDEADRAIERKGPQGPRIGIAQEVTVTGYRGRDSTLGETLSALPTTMVGRAQRNVAGLEQRIGYSGESKGKLRLWQATVLPRAVQEAQQQGIDITEHPDVIEYAQRAGVRPDVFARDWTMFTKQDPNDPSKLTFDPVKANKIYVEAVRQLREGKELREKGKERARLASQTMEAFAPNLKEWDRKSILFDAISSAPEMVASVLGRVVGGPAAGLGTLFLTTAPAAYADAEDMGLSPAKRDAYALLVGLAEVAPETPVLEVLAKSARGKRLMSDILGKYVESAGYRIATTGLLEGMSETLTEALNIGIEAGVLEKNTPLPEALNRLARANVVGTVMGSGVASVTETIGSLGRAPSEDGGEAPELPRTSRLDSGPPPSSPPPGELSAGTRPMPPPPREETAPAPQPEMAPAPKPQAPPTPEAMETASTAPKAEVRPKTVSMAPDALIDDLKAVQDGKATPEQVARLEKQKLVIRNETNVPRLLPEGRRRLAAGLTARAAEKKTMEAKAAGQPVTVNVEPTEAQKRAGNYQKGTVKIAGMDIAIENPKGSVRRGTDESGQSWEREMPYDYGYVKRTEGADGDQVDVYIGPNPESKKVFVVDQMKSDGTFDEHKALIGFNNIEQAKAAYQSNYPKGWKGMGAVTEMTVEEFRDWAQNGDTKAPLKRDTVRFSAVYKGDEPLEPQRANTNTPMFKEFFRGSKVKDKDGKPLPVYHGSGTDIREFKYEFTGKGNDQLGPGFYFTTDVNEARGYQEKTNRTGEEKLGGTDDHTVHEVYLAIKKPLDADKIGNLSISQVRRIIEDAPDLEDSLSNWGDVEYEGFGKVLLEASKEYAGKQINILKQLQTIANDFYSDDPASFFKAVKSVLGYDGVTAKVGGGDGTRVHWVAWFPEQIKSTSNEAPNKRSRNIYFSASRQKEEPAGKKRQKRTFPPGSIERSRFFSEWFGDSKVVDPETGAPLMVFHGTKRPDRVGSQFRKSRATSGPMAFFTDDPKVASKYATEKDDTSITEIPPFQDWFVVYPGGKQKPYPVGWLWYRMTPEERKSFIDKMLRLRKIDAPEGEKGFRIAEDPEGGYIPRETFERSMRASNGNGILAAADVWLSSTLFGTEELFMDVLRLSGVPMKGVVYEPPGAKDAPAVVPVFMSIQNPLDTSKITPEIIAGIEAASKRTRQRYKAMGDPWHKRAMNPEDFVQILKVDQERNTTHAWTSIPDWVTEELKRQGFDGIKDTGGKFAGTESKHAVWIPFEPTQVKAAFGNRGTFDPTSKNILFSANFKSALVSALEASNQKSASGAQWLGIINNLTTKGVKQEEIDWTDISADIDPNSTYTKEQIVDFARARQVVVTEAEEGDKYRIWSRPGGKKYTELVLKWKHRMALFASPHYKNTPNILAHVRFDERIDENGTRTLLLHEVQSDWHQKGRQYGYRKQNSEDALNAARAKLADAKVAAEIAIVRNDNLGFYTLDRALNEILISGKNWKQRWTFKSDEDVAAIERFLAAKEKAATEFEKLNSMVPPAPFRATWPELVIKRMAMYAAENGFDRIAWSDGEVQSARYNLATAVDSISWEHVGDGIKAVYITRPSPNNDPIMMRVDMWGRVVKSPHLPEAVGMKLDDVVGAPNARKIFKYDEGVLDKDELSKSARGMVQFYDKVLVESVNKLVRKFGSSVVKISEAEEPELGDGWAFEVTPQMREAALGGLPLFSKAKPALQPQRWTGKGMSVGDVERVVMKSTASLRQPNIKVVQTDSELPRPIIKAMREQGVKDPKGVFDGEAIYLIAENIESETDAFDTIMHELVVHYGLRELFAATPAEFDAFLDGVIKDRNPALRRLADRKGLPFKTLTEQRLVAEEYMADMAGFVLRGEPMPKEDFSIWQRLVELAYKALDALGIRKHFSDKRIAELIRNSHWNLYTGSPWSDSFARRYLEGLKDRPLYSRSGVPIWHSPMIEALSSERVQKEASPREWIRIIESKLSIPYTDLSDKRRKTIGTGEIRMDEIKWTGVFEWLGNLDTYSLVQYIPAADLTPRMIDPKLHPWLEKIHMARDFIKSYDVLMELNQENYQTVMDRELAVMTDLVNKMFPDRKNPAKVTFSNKRRWLNEVSDFRYELDQMISPSGDLHGLPVRRVPKQAIIRFLEDTRAKVFVTDATRKESESSVSVEFSGPEELRSYDDHLEIAKETWRKDSDLREEKAKHWLERHVRAGIEADEAESIGRDAFDVSDEDWEGVLSGDLVLTADDVKSGYAAQVADYFDLDWVDSYIESMAHDAYYHDEAKVWYGTARYYDTDYDVRIEYDGHSRYEAFVEGESIGAKNRFSNAEALIEEYIAETGERDEGDFRWYEYTMPLVGRDTSNYYEKLLVWENPPDYVTDFRETAHWDYDDKNYLAHIRAFVAERKDGKEFLILDELQSDWHKYVKKQLARARTSDEAKRIVINAATKILNRVRSYVEERSEEIIDAIDKSFVSEKEFPIYRKHLLTYFGTPSFSGSINDLIANHPYDADINAASIIFNLESETLDGLKEALRQADREFLKNLELKHQDYREMKALIVPDQYGSWFFPPSLRFHGVRRRVLEGRHIPYISFGTIAWDSPEYVYSVIDLASKDDSHQFVRKYRYIMNNEATRDVPEIRSAREIFEKAIEVAREINNAIKAYEANDGNTDASEKLIALADIVEKHSGLASVGVNSRVPGHAANGKVDANFIRAVADVFRESIEGDIYKNDFVVYFLPESMKPTAEQIHKLAKDAHMRELDVAGKNGRPRFPLLFINKTNEVKEERLEITEQTSVIFHTVPIDVSKVVVPPLARTWPIAAFQWALREAAEKGLRGVAISNGEVHGVRWKGTIRAFMAARNNSCVHGKNALPAILKKGSIVFNEDKEPFGIIREGDKYVVDSVLWPLFESAEWKEKGELTKEFANDEPILIWRGRYESGGDVNGIITTRSRAKGWLGAAEAKRVLEGFDADSPPAEKEEVWWPRAFNSDYIDRHHGSMVIYNEIIPIMLNDYLKKMKLKLTPMLFKIEKHEDPGGLNISEEDKSAAILIGIEFTPEAEEQAKKSMPLLFSAKWYSRAKAAQNAVINGTNDFDVAEPGSLSRAWNWLVFKMQDKFIDLFKTQEEAKAWHQMTQLPDDWDAYLQQTLYHGRVENKVAEYEKQFVEPLVKAIKASGYEWEDVEDFLYARHAPEANAHLLKINDGDPTYNSGMSDADAMAVMAKLSSMGDIKKLHEIGRMVDQMTKWTRDQMVMNGLEDASTIEEWEKTYQFYVPLKGWRDMANDPDVSAFLNLPSKGMGYDTGAKLTKARTGRTSLAANILANVVAQAHATIILSEKAKVGRAFYEFVKNTPSTRLWSVDEVEYMRYVDKTTGLVRKGINPQYKLADNVIRVRKDGKIYHITLSDTNPEMRRLAAALKNLSPDQVGPILGFMHGVNRVLSSLNTSLNPEFTVTNALRDLQTALVNLNEQDIEGIKTSIIRDWRSAWWGIRRGERGKNAEWAQEWQRFKRAGGKVGWIDQYKSPVDLESKLRRMMGPDNVISWTAEGIRAVGEFIETENLAIENAIRLSTFVNLTRKGVSEQRAAEYAKNLTVNFNRKGEAGTFLNSLYLFYNAAIQGTARLFAAAKNPKARKVMIGMVALGIGMDILNRMLGGEDDDKENLYDKISSVDKERNIIIMLPPEQRFTLKSGEKISYLKIPLPYGFNVIYNSGTALGKLVDHAFIGNVRRYSAQEEAALMAGSFIGAFSPIGDYSTLSQFLLPTMADPFVQISENRAWHGGRLMPEDYPGQPPSPDSQKFYRSVPLAYREVAAWLNEKTGGTDITPGAIDVSPATIQHWVGFATGGLGRFLESAINVPATLALAPEELEAKEIAFMRKVVGGIGDRETQETFYQHLTQIDRAKKEIDAVYELGIQTEEGQKRLQYVSRKYPVAVTMIREVYPNFATGRSDEERGRSRTLKQLKESIAVPKPSNAEPQPTRGKRRSLTTELREARREIRRLEARPDMPAKERKERIAAEKEKIRKIMIEFNRRWNEVEDSMMGERNSRNLIGTLGPIIYGKSRAQMARSLRENGFGSTAELLASLPPLPDKYAREFFMQEAAREES